MNIDGLLIETGDRVRVETSGSQIVLLRSLDKAPASWIAPGFIDIQVNGYAGHDVNAVDVTPDVISDLVRSLWPRGLTALCPTVTTQSEERMCRSLRAIADACAADPLIARCIPSIHVEGPYISPEDGPRGAHPREHVRPPNLDEYRRWQDTAGGRVGIITLAPEYRGAADYIRAVAADGVIVSIGHTAADDDQIREAVATGARLSTHLGNGAHAQLRRHPNYIWAQLADDRLMASVICDGHHLPPAVMKSMLRAKGLERVILVSDAVALAGMPPGIYETPVGGAVELLPDGRLMLRGTPYLAGSTSSLPDCIANVVQHTGVSLAEAVRLASLNPARLLGLDWREKRGSVRVGAAADLTVFHVDPATGELIVEATIVGGEAVYQRDR